MEMCVECTYCIKCDQITSTYVAYTHLRNLTFQSMQTGNSSYRCLQHIPLANVRIFQLRDQPLCLTLFLDIIKRYLANVNNIRFSQFILSKHIVIYFKSLETWGMQEQTAATASSAKYLARYR
jgi:hypothetical protein